MSVQDPLVYHDGALKAASEARFSAFDHATLYGVGFFETFAVRAGGRPVLWPAHASRMARACERLDLRVSPRSLLCGGEARLKAVLGKLMADRGLDAAIARYTVTGGVPDPAAFPPECYAAPGELLAIRPMPPDLPGGLRLRLLATPRTGADFEPRPKSVGYLNNLVALKELHAVDPKADEGVMLDRNGCVTECISSNLMWHSRGTWRYPSPALGALPGVCLDWTLRSMGDAGAILRPVAVQAWELQDADAVLVLNSARGPRPVREILFADGKPLWVAPATQCPEAEALVSAWSAL